MSICQNQINLLDLSNNRFNGLEWEWVKILEVARLLCRLLIDLERLSQAAELKSAPA